MKLYSATITIPESDKDYLKNLENLGIDTSYLFFMLEKDYKVGNVSIPEPLLKPLSKLYPTQAKHSCDLKELVLQTILLLPNQITQFQIENLQSKITERFNYNLNSIDKQDLFSEIHNSVKELLTEKIILEDALQGHLDLPGNLIPNPETNEDWAKDVFLKSYSQHLSAVLLSNLKKFQPEIENLLKDINKRQHDQFYRIYHHSFKAYYLTDSTIKMEELIKKIQPKSSLSKPTTRKYLGELNESYSKTTEEGKLKFHLSHNAHWEEKTNQLLLAYSHNKFFLEAMIEAYKELKDEVLPPQSLPSSWAAVLYLYNLR